MPRPLEGLRVADFSQGVAGPYCAMLLGDLGADVVKIEPLRGDWARTMGSRVRGESTTFLSVNRNKRSLCLDLKAPEGRRIAERLAARSDVLVESFRPGVMDRLGLGHERLAEANARLVYCSVSGFGQEGPYVDLPAGDSTMQAFGGLMSIIGERGGTPLRVGNVVSDMLAGMNAFEGVLAALLTRTRTERGQRVCVSLLDALVAFQAPTLTEYLATGQVPVRTGNEHPLLAPSGAVRTADSYIVFSVLQHQWAGFCRGLGLAALADDPRFATNQDRVANRAALNAVLEPIFRERTTATWLEVLRQRDVLCAPINDYEALAKDEQVRGNGLFEQVPHPTLGMAPVVRNPIRLGETTLAYTAPPLLGGHSRSVLIDELGHTAAEVEALVAAGVVHDSGAEQRG